MSITIKAARVNQDLTQKEAAKLLNISFNTLINYELGKSLPNIEILQRMEQVYKMPYSELNFFPNNSI